jgi:ribosome biogenesis ATPase
MDNSVTITKINPTSGTLNGNKLPAESEAPKQTQTQTTIPNKDLNIQTSNILSKLKTTSVTVNKKRRIEHDDNMVTGQQVQQQQPPQSFAGHQTQPPQQQQQQQPKAKKFKKEVYAKKSNYTFADVGGMDKTLKELCELILHIKHPEIYRHIGLPSPRGFLLHGPPGSGKNLLAHAIAGQLDVSLIEIPATELIAGVSGESEERIREIFEQSAALAPCVLFIDEIDAISSNRMNAQKDMERRIVAQLLTSLDNLSKLNFGDQVLVIGATNRVDSLDPALRRVGRFDHEICLGIPDRDARCEILQVITKNLRLETPFDFDELAALTPGYVGADLLALATKAASTAIKRVLSKKENEELIASLKVNACADKNADVPIVNLDEDSILMEVDDSAEGAKATEETDEVSEKPEPEKPETVKPEEVPTKETVEENGTVPETPQETKTEEEKIEEIKDKVVEEEKPIEKEPEAMEQGEEPTEQKAPIEEKAIEEKTVVEQEIIEETDDVVEVPLNEKDKELALAQAVMRHPGVVLQMSLDNMIKWLRHDATPLSNEEMNRMFIMRQDFLDALKSVQPSAKREGFITVPDVTWDDVGSLRSIREELKLAILAPVKFPDRLKILGLQSPSGVLLCGPPGKYLNNFNFKLIDK